LIFDEPLQANRFEYEFELEDEYDWGTIQSKEKRAGEKKQTFSSSDLE
jgi:hypothetical protein